MSQNKQQYYAVHKVHKKYGRFMALFENIVDAQQWADERNFNGDIVITTVTEVDMISMRDMVKRDQPVQIPDLTVKKYNDTRPPAEFFPEYKTNDFVDLACESPYNCGTTIKRIVSSARYSRKQGRKIMCEPCRLRYAKASLNPRNEDRRYDS